MANSYSEDNFWLTIWEFLPGIIKFLSGLGIIYLLVSVVTISLGSKSDVRSKSKTFDINIQRDYNTTFGNADSKVKLVYFQDLQCPACKANHDTMEKFQTGYKDKIYIVYKHYPLSQHPYAKLAAQATQAAGRQNKFLDFADQAYKVPDQNLTSSNLEGVARNLSLDIDKWNSDRFSSDIVKEVAADQKDMDESVLPTSSVTGKAKLANDLKDIGTPISILYKNGVAIDWWTGGMPIDQLTQIVDKALN